jgi:hypothetical protein
MPCPPDQHRRGEIALVASFVADAQNAKRFDKVAE